MVIYESPEKCVFYVLFFLEKYIKTAWISQEKCVNFALYFPEKCVILYIVSVKGGIL